MCEYNEMGMRHFLTTEEKIELLKDHKENLEQEVKGISEVIKELEKKEKGAK